VKSAVILAAAHIAANGNWAHPDVAPVETAPEGSRLPKIPPEIKRPRRGGSCVGAYRGMASRDDGPCSRINHSALLRPVAHKLSVYAQPHTCRTADAFTRPDPVQAQRGFPFPQHEGNSSPEASGCRSRSTVGRTGVSDSGASKAEITASGPAGPCRISRPSASPFSRLPDLNRPIHEWAALSLID
jgi:hypothetical protein